MRIYTLTRDKKVQTLTSTTGLTALDTSVHVYYEVFDQNQPLPDFKNLSSEEQVRAATYRNAEARKQFMWTRSRLRELLSKHLEVDARQLVLGYGRYGKPYLVDLKQHRSLEFNVSHSGNMALYGFTRGAKLGVDIEILRPTCAALAKRILTLEELRISTPMPDKTRQSAIITAWSCKEAVLKGLGSGLQGQLPSIEAPADILLTGEGDFIYQENKNAKSWRIWAWSPVTGYRAAVAVNDEHRHLVKKTLGRL